VPLVPVLRRKPDQATISDRARGVMLGLAVGDALGAAVEWLEPGQITARHGGPLRDLTASTAWELGEWTDDTAMALALAESLADRSGWDEDDVLARYLVWERAAPRDIAPSVRAALTRARTPEDAREAALRYRRLSLDGGPDNASLCRAAPIAIRYRADAGALERVSRADAGLTHDDPLAGDAGVILNLTIAALIMGRKLPRSTSALGQLSESAKAETAADLLPAVQTELIHVLTATRVAYAAAFGHETFEDALVFAVNLGGDADSNGAVAGALAGARFGASQIPARWLEPLRARDRIAGVALRLLRA
jgi:ADP-ribosylglycohydrolase